MTPNQASLLLGIPATRIEQWARSRRVRRLLLPRIGSVRVRLLVDVAGVQAYAGVPALPESSSHA